VPKETTRSLGGSPKEGLLGGLGTILRVRSRKDNSLGKVEDCILVKGHLECIFGVNTSGLKGCCS
jgi:hypothetical protein